MKIKVGYFQLNYLWFRFSFDPLSFCLFLTVLSFCQKKKLAYWNILKQNSAICLPKLIFWLCIWTPSGLCWLHVLGDFQKHNFRHTILCFSTVTAYNKTMHEKLPKWYRWPRQHSNQIGYPWTGIEEILAFYARMTSKPTSNVAGCSLIQLTGVRSTHGQGKVKPLSQSAQSYVSEQTGAPLFGGCHEMMGVQSLDEIIWLSSFDFLEVRLSVLRHDLSNTIATKRSKCIHGYSSFSSF